jgi:hypothetical protein
MKISKLQHQKSYFEEKINKSINILLILIFIGIQFGAFQLFAIGSFGFQASYFFMIILYFVLIKKNFWNQPGFSFPNNYLIGMLGLLGVSVLLSGFTPFFSGSNPQTAQFLKSAVHIFFLMAFVFLISISEIKAKAWTNAIKAVLLIAVFINAFGVYQIFARGFDLPFAWLEITNVSYSIRGEIDADDIQQLSLKYGNFYRATSFFSEPSFLASFNVYILTFMVVPYVQRKKQFINSKIFNIINFSLALVANFLTFSLTGLVGLFLLVVALFMFEERKRLLAIIPILALSMGVLFVVDGVVKKYTEVSVAELFAKRLEGLYYLTKGRKHFTYGETVGVRSTAAEKSYLIWRDNPINGCGLGLTGYQKKYQLGFGDFTILAALAELGMIGFFVFTGVFIALLYYTRRMLRNKDDPDISPEKQVLYGISFYIVVHLFELNFITSNSLINQALWVPLGLIVGVMRSYYVTYNKRMIVVNNFAMPLRKMFNNSIKAYLINKKKA